MWKVTPKTKSKRTSRVQRWSLCILVGISFLSQAQQDILKARDALSPSSLYVVGIDSVFLHSKVDSIISNGIKNKAFPGARLLVAHSGKIIFNESYGYHTYDSITPVQENDLFDLASVTKIIGPLPALMKLYDEGNLNLDVPFSTYWKPWRHQKDKKNITLREILAHQAGLEPYIVFLNEVFRKNGTLKKRFVRQTPSPKHSLQAYDGIFIKDRFKHKMYRHMNRSVVSPEKKYKYSGLTFLIFPELIAQRTGMPYADYLQQTFYKPLGTKTLGFLPKTKNFANAIVPTEVDTLFRKSLTQNWVHDENASLMGGVSGNAGLFATAEDLAIFMQMYLQYGRYDGKRYISEATVKEFSKVQYPENDNRRGLGFDKPLLNNAQLPLKEAYPAPEVSPESFGHSGFTGTFVWADPKKKLVFIFLSNRVYPTRKHNSISTLNIRPALQQLFYQALQPN
ncbi:serine hydrolase [Arenibacter sp. GZD96]|uniref:serine hydrolase domain-containing protein n=1 Tax=Aurantibrevibacter litoralis TaxID=3106030 RepID=UPI002AFEE939|nr:serine hydrolase [Arenibacter sp. GZD-96]MEA1787564.1 serine hydrolase [Arenibacter sp. GZD-96]